MASQQAIIFDVSSTSCALRRNAVRELLPLPRLWRPPALPRPVAGFFNLSGKAVPVLRLNVLFGLEQGTANQETELYRHLILVEALGRSGPCALLVDRVQDVVDLAGARLSRVSETDTLNGCVEAEIEFRGGLVHLLSLERILFAEEQQSLVELGRDAQNRLGEWAASA
jgi:purine-binding chemotaxis protein CheW